jgi:hypothetical protein
MEKKLENISNIKEGYNINKSSVNQIINSLPELTTESNNRIKDMVNNYLQMKYYILLIFIFKSIFIVSGQY